MATLTKFASTLLLVSSLTSCSTTQKVAKSTEIAYHGNVQNAGVLSVESQGAIVDQQFVNAYNTNIKNGFGTKWALKQNDGLLPLANGTTRLDRQHFIYALTMIQLASTQIQK